ncbi:CBO0543 family protein [Aquibacillus rhizosphaerae]|uniref:CBO0543 family protein n=1 Tax=Aquibacillus rhizosphaerae TaxID=3051431 RepID=A0ABT7L9I0_9BACI|nr:CBO0543 family protein [Aquibacillus sp. LR5S19]MDL4842521.1 CBO0543 family protein [Aquibacillus sp. LR5S19]
MIVEWKILIFVWTLTVALLFIIPKDKKRLALVAFLFKQVITLLIGLVVVEFNLISYPVRLFSEVNRASFTYEFLVYPVICSVFIVFYPNYRSYLYKLGYYFAFCTALTVPEIFLEKYTDLINYIHWSWYWTWITLFITFMLSRQFCVWFFRDISKNME